MPSYYDSDFEEVPEYEGDEDEYIDEEKGFSKKCENLSILMGNKISVLNSEEKYNPNVIMFIREKPDKTYLIDCFLYSELKDFLNSAPPVFHWEGGDLGRPIESLPLYLLPAGEVKDTEIWFEGNYGLLSRYSAFLLYSPKQTKIGSSFSSSARHGSLEYVWRVRPISKTKFLKEGIVENNKFIISEPLDFSPGNYPGYEVFVELLDDEDRKIYNCMCVEAEVASDHLVVNIFYINGSTKITFDSTATEDCALKTRLKYGKTYFEDGSFIYTGEKRSVITDYNNEIESDASLMVEPMEDNKGVSITYTKKGKLMWREKIVAPIEVKGGYIEENLEENLEAEDEEESPDLDEFNETEFMINSAEAEIEVINEDISDSDKFVGIDEDTVDDDIPRNTTILVINIPYSSSFKLPSPDEVPNLTKLSISLLPPKEEYESVNITIPYYPNLEYLSINATNLYYGIVYFTDPPVEDVSGSPLRVISLNNIHINDLPVGVNAERLFITDIKHMSLDGQLLKNRILEGDEDPTTLRGLYPSLKFLCVNFDPSIPDLPDLCVIYWVGPPDSVLEHEERVKVISGGDPIVYLSMSMDLNCDT